MTKFSILIAGRFIGRALLAVAGTAAVWSWAVAQSDPPERAAGVEAARTSSTAPSGAAAELARVDAERGRTGLAPVLLQGSARPDQQGRYRYTVVLRPEIVDSRARSFTVDLAGREGLTGLEPFSGPLLNGFEAVLTPQALERLRREAAVRYIEQSLPVVIWDTVSAPSWGQDRIDSPVPSLNGSIERGWLIRPVRLYVVDTGIYNGHSNNWHARFHPGVSTVSDPNPVSDTNGHGTHVAGTAGGNRFGVTTDLDVYSVKTFVTGTTTIPAITNGLNWIATQGHPRSIVNLSSGIMGGTSLALDQAIQGLITNGVTVVVAAGNENVDACLRSPSRVTAAIVVGATKRPTFGKDRKYDDSNWGSCVDLYAPGDNIVSAGISGPYATTTLSGTSMAAPHVAGLAAHYVAENLPPAQVEARLLADAVSGTILGWSSSRMAYLKGMPDGRAAGAMTATTVSDNPLFGVKTSGQVFILWKDPTDGLLKVGDVPGVSAMPGSLALGNLGDDVWGVRSNGDLVRGYWNAGAWQAQTLPVWGGGAAAGTLLSTGDPNPVIGVKNSGQVFIVWSNSGTWAVGNIPCVVTPTTRALARGHTGGGDVWGVRPDGNLARCFWSGGSWQAQTVNVWGGGASAGSLLSTGQNNPIFGVKKSGQLFIVWSNSGTWAVGDIPGVTVVPGSLVLGNQGGDVWGVKPDGNLVHAYWSNGAWQSETVAVWGGGAKPGSLVSTGQPNPVYGVKPNGQAFIVWRDPAANAWAVGNVRDIFVRSGTLLVDRRGDLFGQRLDGNIFKSWWDTQSWEATTQVW